MIVQFHVSGVKRETHSRRFKAVCHIIWIFINLIWIKCYMAGICSSLQMWRGRMTDVWKEDWQTHTVWRKPPCALTAFALAVEEEGERKEKHKQQDGGAHRTNGDNSHRNNVWNKHRQKKGSGLRDSCYRNRRGYGVVWAEILLCPTVA